MTRLSEFTAAMLLFIAPAAVQAGGAADERADAFCHAAAPRLPETFNNHARPVLALMSIASTHAPVQWIAHEFEHLVEQLDGLDLRVLAAGRRGVWRSAPDTFETERAIAAGRRVLDEIHAFQRSDNLVE